MTMGRPPGRASRSPIGPPILHEGPGRSDDWKPDYCDSCKVPAKSAKLLTFELRMGGKPAGEWTLCEPCWRWRQDQRPVLNPDPLYVAEENAA
jgi:hypothetical protein